MKTFFFKLVLFTFIIVSLLPGQQYSVLLDINNNNHFNLEHKKNLAFRPKPYNSDNFLFSDSLNIENYYELTFYEDFSFISVIQTKSGEFYIDKNLNRVLEEDEILKFTKEGYLDRAIVQLNLTSNFITTFSINLIPMQNLIILQSNPAFCGKINIENNYYDVVLIFSPVVLSFSYKKQLKIGIDLNKDKIISTSETISFDGIIKVDENTLAPMDIKYKNGKVEIIFRKSSEETFLGLGFIHPRLEIRGIFSESETEISDFEGKIVVINWWGINCGPCLIEIPELNKLKNDFMDNSYIDFIAFSSDNSFEIEKFLTNNKFTFRQFYVDRVDAKNLGIRAIPRTLVLDENGKIIFDEQGYNQKKGLEDIRKLLREIH